MKIQSGLYRNIQINIFDLFIVNEKAWYDLGDILDTYLANYHTDGTYMWSMKANDYVSVGAKGFDSYNWQGNTVSFKVDRTFSREFGLTFLAHLQQ